MASFLFSFRPVNLKTGTAGSQVIPSNEAASVFQPDFGKRSAIFNTPPPSWGYYNATLNDYIENAIDYTPGAVSLTSTNAVLDARPNVGPSQEDIAQLYFVDPSMLGG